MPDISGDSQSTPSSSARPLTGPLIVGSSGASDSDAAIVMAQLFQAALRVPVTVVSVMTHLPASYAMGLLPQLLTADTAERDAQVQKIHAQITRVLGTNPEWSVIADFGEAAQVLTSEAIDTNAALIVVGRGRHSVSERLLGGEHVVRMLQLGDTPVFATTSSLDALPERVIIATDFSVRSALAAETALRFISPSAHIFLVSVMPDVEKHGGTWEQEWANSYRAGLNSAFDQAIAEIAREGLTIEPITLVGDAAEELIAFSKSQRADLVVSGTHGHGFFRRMILGSVANELVRGVDCSLLCVPAHGEAAAG